MANKRKTSDRVERLVTLQEKVVKDWADYAQHTAALITTGTMLTPGAWMNEYTSLSKSVAENFSELLRIVSGRAPRHPAVRKSRGRAAVRKSRGR